MAASKNNITPIDSEVTNIVQATNDLAKIVYVAPEPTIVDPVTIILDPATPDKYHMRLDFRAMRLIQKETGDIMWDSSIFEKGAPSPEKLLVYIWACLQWEHPDLTGEDLEIMPGFHMMNLPYLVDRFYANWNISMPDTSENTSETKTDPN